MTSLRQEALQPPSSAIATAHIVYALHAVSLAIGAFGAATVVGAFLFGWPSIIAVILNYVQRKDARDTWLESHYRWQIRTFWLALVWGAIIAVFSALTAIILIGFAAWIVGLFALGIWAIIRIGRGWLVLADRRPIGRE
jgi:uncharacterized membrane protein